MGLIPAIIGGAVVSGLGKAFGARKAEKTSRHAERHNQQTLIDAAGRAENALRQFLPTTQGRSDVASNVLLQTLQDLGAGANPGQFEPSPRALNTIRDLSRQALERSAARGLSQSGGLQGELERIRTGVILDDEQRQRDNAQRGFTNRLNLLTRIAPFATETQNLTGQIEGINLNLADKIADERRGHAVRAAPQFNQLGAALGDTLSGASKGAANFLNSGGRGLF